MDNKIEQIKRQPIVYDALNHYAEAIKNWGTKDNTPHKVIAAENENDKGNTIMLKENNDQLDIIKLKTLLTDEFLETLKQVEELGNWDDEVETGKFVDRCFELAGKPSENVRDVRIVHIKDSWVVRYVKREKFTRHLAAQFCDNDNTLTEVKDWVNQQRNLRLVNVDFIKEP